MCGRYQLSRRKQLVEEYFDAGSDESEWTPRYNIAPTQQVPVIRQNPKEPRRELSLMWDRWKDPSGQWVKSCSILTTTPNAVTSTVHDRMPVILDRADYDLWLDPGMTNVEAVSGMLKPYDARIMRCYPVSSRVNHVANDDPECSTPLELTETQTGLFILLTAEELAELLQMSRITILRRAKRGSIPSFRVGSCVRFDSAAIAKWLMQQGVQRMSKG